MAQVARNRQVEGQGFDARRRKRQRGDAGRQEHGWEWWDKLKELRDGAHFLKRTLVRSAFEVFFPIQLN